MSTNQDLFDLHGRTALITGASRGIGLAIARTLGLAGAKVTLTARKAEPLQRAAQDLCAQGIDALGLPCHQGDPCAIASLFEHLDQENRTPNILVINAATNPVHGPLLDLELDAWRKILEVNLTGALVTAQHGARRMVQHGRGSVILLSSIAGLEPMPGLGAYSVSKMGLLTLMRALARELGPHGVRVNALAPGLIETQLSAALFADQEGYRRFLAGVALGRHGQPQDLVGAALFLAGEASAYMTGQVLVVDGGRVLH